MGGLQADLLPVLPGLYRREPLQRSYRSDAISRTHPLQRTNGFINLLEFVTKLQNDPCYIHGISFPASCGLLALEVKPNGLTGKTHLINLAAETHSL
jgi:hypothetical protein